MGWGEAGPGSLQGPGPNSSKPRRTSANRIISITQVDMRRLTSRRRKRCRVEVANSRHILSILFRTASSAPERIWTPRTTRRPTSLRTQRVINVQRGQIPAPVPGILSQFLATLSIRSSVGLRSSRDLVVDVLEGPPRRQRRLTEPSGLPQVQIEQRLECEVGCCRSRSPSGSKLTALLASSYVL